MECPPGSGRLPRGANLKMRDFHSSICFLCVSGVGWIVKYGGYSKKSGKAKAPAILAAPSSLGSASGRVVPS